MAENSKIEWCGPTFNPWFGCSKVSEGCAHCYAEQSSPAKVARSKGHETWGKGAPRIRTSAGNWQQPLKWDKHAQKSRLFQGFIWRQWGESTTVDQPDSFRILADTEDYPSEERKTKEFTQTEWEALPRYRPRVFCASLADWLDDEVPTEWLYDLLDLIQRTPNLDWLLLTKRPENWRSQLLKYRQGHSSDRADDFIDSWLDGTPPHNVWIGATAENQQRFNERYMPLAEIPAKLRFWSMEPLLDSIDFTAVHYDFSFKSKFHWVITGGESGSKEKARHCHTDDIRDIVSQCELFDVPCFVKQLGTNPVAAGRDQKDLIAMRDKKGGDWSEWPEALRVRQFPKVERSPAP